MPVMARAQDSVASLLLNTCGPETYRRSPVSGLPRAPLCMMGVCFECLVEVDGHAHSASDGRSAAMNAPDLLVIGGVPLAFQRRRRRAALAFRSS
jgi:hypothetical protein